MDLSKPPPLPKSPWRSRISPIAAVLAQRTLCQILAFLFLAGGVYVALGGRLWTCLFYRTFHRPCLTCGMTRGVRKCLTGEVETAWHFHPFAPVIVMVMGLIVTSVILPKAVHARLIERLKTFEERSCISLILLLLFLGYGILRAMNLFPFPY